MNNFACYGKKLQHFCSGCLQFTRLFICCYGKKLQQLCSGCLMFTRLFICGCYRYLLFRINPFLIHIIYFISISFLGFGILKALKPKTEFRPSDLDLFFTSVSATTVSSMSTVEMEVFSNSQLILMTILMLVGGEVFTSMVGLHLKRSKIIRTYKSGVESLESEPGSPSPPHNINLFDQIELNIVRVNDSGLSRVESRDNVLPSYNPFLKYASMKFLGLVVVSYLVLIHILGVMSVLAYFSLISSAENVLRQKGLKTSTFAFFTVVSTFASCGFVPTNENMMVFSKNSGLLWVLIPQMLLGNTLFPSCLRFVIWVLGKKIKKVEAKYLLENSQASGYHHLLPGLHSVLLVLTVLVFILVGIILFCSLEWSSEALRGMSSYEKVVGVIFQCANARHTGETIVDLSTIAPAILVFFVVLMYLPPYTSFLPIKRDEEWSHQGMKKKGRNTFAENLVFSQLFYLVIFIVLVCITESKNLKDDPLNFSVFNIVVEVISAYGNVGFTTGYSCERQRRPNPNCVNKWYGFCGRWSDEGKIVLTILMVFGRLKKFNMNGGQAWKLL